MGLAEDGNVGVAEADCSVGVSDLVCSWDSLKNRLHIVHMCAHGTKVLCTHSSW